MNIIIGTLALSMTDQVNPGESYDPLLMSISVDEGEETG
jgi:hypothetical protein